MKKMLLFLGINALALSTSVAQSFTVTVKSNPANSSFRYVISAPADMNSRFGGNGMIIADWTASGTPYVWRSYLKFNLPVLPAGSVIDTAYLSFYANPTSPSGNPGNPTYGTDNAVGIYRSTAAWDTSTISWVTQPAFTTVHGDTLAQSTSYTQDYLNVNATDLVKDCYTLGNYGFVMKHLQETTVYNSMIFYSPYQYAVDSNKTPRLVLKYRNTVGIAETGANNATMDIFPNPAHGSANIYINGLVNDELSVSVSDVSGRMLSTQQIADKITLDLTGYAKGLYIIALRNKTGIIETKKLVVE